MKPYLGVCVLLLISSASVSAQSQRFEVAVELAPNGERAAWGDYDNDGFVDLYADTALWRNRGGTLVADAGDAVLEGYGVWADFNNDGWLDFFRYTDDQQVYLNDQKGNFVSGPHETIGAQISRGAVAGDLNGDGFADVYVGAYEQYPTAYFADKIAMGDGHGALSVIWTQGLDSVMTPGRPCPARGVTSADWDRDGDLDVYVSNYRLEPNLLWRNDGTGTFVNVAPTHNAVATSSGFPGGHTIGSVFADFDNDGLLDLFVGNFAHAGQPEPRFLKNLGAAQDYRFEDMGTGGIRYQESFASPTAGDIDNDGDLDLYFTTVYTSSTGGVANHPVLLRNDGNFTFTDVTEEWGLPLKGVATYQAAFADYDNDGYLDLATSGKVYRNTGGSNHWLKVRLEGGSAFGKSPTGAQVIIALDGKTLVRHIESGVGEGNQNDATLHFGLGQHDGPVTLLVYWPGRTSPQSVTLEKVNQVVEVLADQDARATR